MSTGQSVKAHDVKVFFRCGDMRYNIVICWLESLSSIHKYTIHIAISHD